MIGFKASRAENALLPVSAYLFVAFAVLLGSLTPWALLVLLSLPLAASNLRVIAGSGEEDARENSATWCSAALHLVFGILLPVGIAAGAVLGP